MTWNSLHVNGDLGFPLPILDCILNELPPNERRLVRLVCKLWAKWVPQALLGKNNYYKCPKLAIKAYDLRLHFLKKSTHFSAQLPPFFFSTQSENKIFTMQEGEYSRLTIKDYGLEVEKIFPFPKDVSCFHMVDNLLFAGFQDGFVGVWALTHQIFSSTHLKKPIIFMGILGSWVYAAAGDQSVYCACYSKATHLEHFHTYTQSITALVLSRKYLVTGHLDGSVVFCERRSKKEAATGAFSLKAVTCLAHNRNFLFSGSSEGIVCIWSLASCERICTVSYCHFAISALALLDNILFVGSEESHIKCYDWHIHLRLRHIWDVGIGKVRALHVLNKHTLVALGEEGKTDLWIFNAPKKSKQYRF